MKYLYRLLPFLLTLVIAPVSGVSVNSGNVEAELISEVTSVEAGRDFQVLLRQDIRPGWHTYWRNPGDSGAPTELTWKLPEGFTAEPMQWPYPERIPYGPLMNFGYEGEVLFPVKIRVPAEIGESQVILQAKGEWLVCEDICIPEDAELTLALPVGGVEYDQDVVQLIDTASRKIPRVMEVPSSFHVDEETLTLAVQMAGLQSDRIESVSYFPYNEGVMDNPTEQEFGLVKAGFELESKVGYDYQPTSNFDGIVIIEENSGEQLVTAFEIRPASTGEVPANGDMSVWLAVLFAFIGGLILNLMPCVFPVLSIKILSLMQETDHLRTHGLVYLTGVVLSFTAIAAVLIGLRESGAEIGWGFQLQSPLVVALLTYLFLLIGLNLSGYFAIGNRLMNIGQDMTEQGGYGGSFFTGVLATVVAAPCTAPFMASAIGFALTQSNLSALIIFASLGFGMATPYLLLCYSPGLLNRLPRPGPWMESAKELLAFPMYGSALWLVWVLSVQTGSYGVLSVGAGALAIVFAIWLLKNLSTRTGARLVTQAIVVGLIISAIYLPNLLQPVSASADVDSSEDAVANGYVGPPYENYSDSRLAELREEGPVFVNFTAAWCITCKVNEAVALNSAVMNQTFKTNDISYLKGDWTNEDPVITRKLAAHGRSGVPLYLLYGGPGSELKILPQLLTEDIVLQAIDGLQAD